MRGGPFDGKQVHTALWVPVTEHGEDGSISVYLPTGELDDEYTTLIRYEHARTEPPPAGSAFGLSGA